MAPIDVTDFDSDSDEGEVPPLLGPGAATPTVASVPSTAPKKPAVAAAPKPASSSSTAPAAPPPPKPGANLKPSSGMRKGFLGGGGSSRPNKATSSSAPSSSSAGGGGGQGGDVPMVRADVDAKAKRLQLPEVQQQIAAEQAEAKKLGADNKNAWMTPELMAKIAANPLLRKGFTDPRCQQAMAEMQTNPSAAMQKYGDQPEMRAFLQAFMKLMGEHFTALADKQEEEKKQQEAAQTLQPALTPEQKKAQEVAQSAMADPEVRAIVAEPKIQELLANMQSGKPFEIEQAMRSDPDVVRKLKKLSQAGLLNMEWKP